jgi:hypothetical protein
MAHDVTDHESSRRRFIKKAAYLTPGILSLAVAPCYAKPGSDRGKGGQEGEKDKNKKKNKDE